MIEKRYFISHQLKQEVYSSLELFFLYAQLSRESSESCAWICRYAQDKQSRCCPDLCWSILHHRSQPTASFPAANLSIPSSPWKHRALSPLLYNWTAGAEGVSCADRAHRCGFLCVCAIGSGRAALDHQPTVTRVSPPPQIWIFVQPWAAHLRLPLPPNHVLHLDYTVFTD